MSKTIFEQWCEVHGWDPAGEFTCVVAHGGNQLQKGDVLSISYDDGTASPDFIIRQGDLKSYQFIIPLCFLEPAPSQFPDRRAHYDLRIAHANGADIQYMGIDGNWYDDDCPSFHHEEGYRMKPKVVHLTKQQICDKFDIDDFQVVDDE